MKIWLIKEIPSLFLLTMTVSYFVVSYAHTRGRILSVVGCLNSPITRVVASSSHNSVAELVFIRATERESDVNVAE